MIACVKPVKRNLEMDNLYLTEQNSQLKAQIKALRDWADNKVENSWWLVNKINEIFGEE